MRVLYNQMNLKIDRVLPYPPSLADPYIFTFIPSLQALLLYPPPPVQDKQEEPAKKKFGFKANSNAAPAMEEVFIFQLARNAWRTQQTKGKFPTRRDNPAVACMGPCMMVYGGKQINPAKQVNDLYCLHLTTWQWKKLFAMEAPNPHPNSLAFAINDENLLVLGKELWVFSAKGVNWELQKGDLPGGIWEKVQGSELSFQLRCGSKIDNELVVFGWDGKLKAVSINLNTKAATNLSIEEEKQSKGQQFQIANTSQGKALLVDGIQFGSFTFQDNAIRFKEWATIEEVVFAKIAAIQLEDSNKNYGITQKKQLALVELSIEKVYEEESTPITARQIEDYMKSSMIQNKELSSPQPRSPVRQEVSTTQLTNQLGPLMAGEWMKRRVLQSKSKLLEDSIKKAEKMVLLLCRYGTQEEKRIHINKVRNIRHLLTASFKRETELRMKMEERQGENHLREYVARQYGDMNAKFLLGEEEE